MSSMAILNAMIRTQDREDPLASAMYIQGNRIKLVGSDALVSSSLPPGTEILDLGGRLVLPGMIDAHAHFLSWAFLLQGLPLSDVRSLREALARVADKAKSVSAGTWILGWGLDESDWPERRLPTGQELETSSPRNPVFIRRRDGHLALANLRALRLAKVDESTPDPPGGKVGRCEDGLPNGILQERAVELVEKIVPEPTNEEGTQALEATFPIMHSLGLTGVVDYRLPGSSEGKIATRIFGRMREMDLLRVRCFMTLSGEIADEAITSGLKPGSGDEKLRIVHFKYFMDGSLGSQTAWMFEPYSDGHEGMPVCSLSELEERISRADARGWPVAVHAIGDRANHELVAIFESVEKNRHGIGGAQFPKLPMPHRIEHAQMMRPEDIARLAGLGVVVSVQPLHTTDDMYMHDRWVGTGAKYAYCFKDFLNAGIPVVFGSDCPVSDPNPLWGIHAAVTRRRRNGDPAGGWYPGQCISVAEAVRAYTADFAASVGLSASLGSISPGKLADVVVLDRDIYSIDPMEIHKASVDMTIFDGEIVFRKEGCR